MNHQPGHIVSLRSETKIDTHAPCGVYNPENPGMANGCAMTDWLELSDDDIKAIFERGEKTIDVAIGGLCDVIDTKRSATYLTPVEEESNG